MFRAFCCYEKSHRNGTHTQFNTSDAKQNKRNVYLRDRRMRQNILLSSVAYTTDFFFIFFFRLLLDTKLTVIFVVVAVDYYSNVMLLLLFSVGQHARYFLLSTTIHKKKKESLDLVALHTAHTTGIHIYTQKRTHSAPSTFHSESKYANIKSIIFFFSIKSVTSFIFFFHLIYTQKQHTHILNTDESAHMNNFLTSTRIWFTTIDVSHSMIMFSSINASYNFFFFEELNGKI